MKDIEQNAKVLIFANPEYGIHKRLESMGIIDWVYCDPKYASMYSDDYVDKTYDRIVANKDSISSVYNLLADDKSRELYKAIFNQWVNHESVYKFSKFFDHNPYFGNNIVPYISGCYVDCGAYTGDTLHRFVNQVGASEYSYYALETEYQNAVKIEEFCKQNNIKNVKVHCIAVWDHKTILNFERAKDDVKVTGKVLQSGKADKGKIVPANSIDNIVKEKIDMISMDIEGAELKAIHGAKEHIKYDCPILAVSIYHNLDDLWKIPLEILELNDRYKIYIRQHRWNIEDTTCYAIVGK